MGLNAGRGMIGQSRPQIDRDPARIGLRYPVEVGLAGDSRKTLAALLPRLRRNEDRSFLERAQRGMIEWWELMRERGTRPDKPMKPQVVACSCYARRCAQSTA